MSVANCRLLRVNRVDQMSSHVILAARGITAGSGSATTEMRMLMLNVVDAVHKLLGCEAEEGKEEADHLDDIAFVEQVSLNTESAAAVQTTPMGSMEDAYEQQDVWGKQWDTGQPRQTSVG